MITTVPAVQKQGSPENTSGLYLHFPFCRRRCHYCHFITRPYLPEAVSDYLGLLTREIHIRAMPETTLDTLYIGGGSPSLLHHSQLERIMDSVRKNFRTHPGMETSVEANPEDLSLEEMQALIQVGCNRISIGIQSLDPSDLAYLGRRHSPQQGLNAIKAAEKAGFKRISIDLIIGLPGQTSKRLGEMISRIHDSPVNHISVYLLERTPNDTRSSEQQGHHLYHQARDLLNGLGFSQYEISNFAQPGEECRHNLRYWKNETYLAAGISAAGYLQGIDYRNTGNIGRYKKAIRSGRTSATKRRFSQEIRRLVTGLRLTEGVGIEAFSGRQETLTTLVDSGIIILKKGKAAIAPEKRLLLNEILARYLL